MQNVCLIVCILVENRNAVGHDEEFQFLYFSYELRRLWGWKLSQPFIHALRSARDADPQRFRGAIMQKPRQGAPAKRFSQATYRHTHRARGGPARPVRDVVAEFIRSSMRSWDRDVLPATRVAQPPGLPQQSTVPQQKAKWQRR